MIEPVQILAAADSIPPGLWIFQALLGLGMLWNGIMSRRQSGDIARIAAETARLNRAEDQRVSSEQALKAQVHELTEKLVDTRFRDITHQLRDHAQGLTLTMDKLAREVDTTKAQINDAKVDLVQTTSEIRENLRDCAPSRDEHNDLKATVKDLAKAVNETAQRSITQTQLVEALREARRDR